MLFIKPLSADVHKGGEMGEGDTLTSVLITPIRLDTARYTGLPITRTHTFT